MSKLYQKIASVTLPDGSETAVWGQWLNQAAANNGIQSSDMTLLLHADDGVIWGQLQGDNLALSSDAFPNDVGVTLRAKTVQQLRLFSEAGELLIWRDGAGFQGRVVVDTAVKTDDYHDEDFLLWGTAIGANDGFTLLQEGGRGLHHAPPGNGETARLKVRHYIQYDEVGQAHFSLSRVVCLDWPKAIGGDNNGS